MHVRACAPGIARDCRRERPLLRHRWATVWSDSAARTHSGAWRRTAHSKRAPAEVTTHSPAEARTSPKRSLVFLLAEEMNSLQSASTRFLLRTLGSHLQDEA